VAPAARGVYVSRPMPSTPIRGRLFVIAAPSGAGKTSLVEALLRRKPELRVSISHTTRPMRPTEEPDREYHFVSVADFQQLVKQGQFLEYAQVFDNYYGTGRRPVETELARGNNVVLEIDWQGARQVRKALPECVSTFILPPSRGALEERLRNRQTDSEQVIARRLRDAVGDMSHWDEFDYVVVNDDFERAVGDLARIVEGQGESLRAQRPQLEPLLAGLLA
jgi:guanylate kinase